MKAAVYRAFGAAADVLKIEDVQRPEPGAGEVRVKVAIELDNGKIGNFEGFRVQHSNARGPFKGGLRFHPQVDMDHANSLASLIFASL